MQTVKQRKALRRLSRYKKGDSVTFLYGTSGTILQSAGPGKFLVQRSDGVKGVFTEAQFQPKQ